MPPRVRKPMMVGIALVTAAFMFALCWYAIGFIETQGFTAVFEAIDNACKAADVEVVGKEKLGGEVLAFVW